MTVGKKIDSSRLYVARLQALAYPSNAQMMQKIVRPRCTCTKSKMGGVTQSGLAIG